MIKKIATTVLFAALVLSLSSGDLMAQTMPDKKLMEDIDGEELQELINSYKGDKAILLNMWATWCGPCVEEFPYIVELQRKYEDQLQVIFVSADFEREVALEFLREQGVDWKTFFKTGKDEEFIDAVSDKWTGAMPFTKIIDTNGNLVANWENKADFSTFETNVKQAINP